MENNSFDLYTVYDYFVLLQNAIIDPLKSVQKGVRS